MLTTGKASEASYQDQCQSLDMSLRQRLSQLYSHFVSLTARCTQYLEKTCNQIQADWYTASEQMNTAGKASEASLQDL